MSDIIRNGKAYDSVDVNVQINAVPINVKSITYGNEQEHQLNHTLGIDATSWSWEKNSIGFHDSYDGRSGSFGACSRW